MNVAQFLHEVTGLETSKCTSASKLADITGWESLAVVQLMIALEGELGRMLEQDELETLNTLGDVEKILGMKV